MATVGMATVGVPFTQTAGGRMGSRSRHRLPAGTLMVLDSRGSVEGYLEVVQDPHALNEMLEPLPIQSGPMKVSHDGIRSQGRAEPIDSSGWLV